MKLFIVSDPGYDEGTLALTDPIEPGYFEVDGEALALREALKNARQQHPQSVLAVQISKDGSFRIATMRMISVVYQSPPNQIALDETNQFVVPFKPN